MFQAAMSASAIGLPSPGVCAKAVPAPSPHASPNARMSLRVDMLDLPFAVDAPARDAVVMLIGERERGRQRFGGLAAGGNKLRAGRLHVAGFIGGPALQDGRLA